MLLGQMLDDPAAGTRLVEAKIVARSAGYPPYEATCAFWEREGFVKVDTSTRCPGSRATPLPSILPPSHQSGNPRSGLTDLYTTTCHAGGIDTRQNGGYVRDGLLQAATWSADRRPTRQVVRRSARRPGCGSSPT
ncbi:MAG: hypothetical protein ABJB47_06035 [Actinomycetota bacterium]